MKESYLLIVEDDEEVSENLALLLELRGCRVETAAHGLEALETIRRLGPPRLVILDLMMPVMNGWELRERLRSDAELAEVPVVLLSGVADVAQAAKALDAIDHLKKPVDFSRLYRIVDCHC